MDLSAFTNPANILTVFVAVATFATLVTLAAPLMRTNNLEARLKSVSTRREELRRKSREALAASKGGSLRQTDAGLYKRVVDRLQLSRLLEDPKVVDKLAQAGFRGPRPVSTFYFFRFVLPFAFAASVAFYLFVINDFGLSGMNRLAAIVVGLTLGYYAPNIYISNIAQKRRESIVGAFPDALDLLLICVESGMSIEAAIQKVSQEIGGSSIELAEEMTLLTAELSYLPERRQAYEGLSRRTNHPGIKSVTTAMIQAERYGTPLGAALRVMAKENRDLRL
ncbi:MAG: type II secretion system F family protein, partial [Phenylobacterium sp.]|nr:type II secretion system F family protein [Phenylobacterium sp.]